MDVVEPYGPFPLTQVGQAMYTVQPFGIEGTWPTGGIDVNDLAAKTRAQHLNLLHHGVKLGLSQSRDR